MFIDDTFLNTDQIDLAQTTARVDVTNGWVTLAKKNLANSLLLYPDSYDVTLINDDAVETYQYDGAEMVLSVGNSINGGLIEPVSIAGRPGEYIVLDRGSKTACWYHYDGIGMVQNGSLGIGPLEDPRAIDVYSATYDFALLDKANLNWYSYDTIGMAPNHFLSFDTGTSGNPVSLSLEDENFACVILDKARKEIRYYSYNGSEMVLDASKSIQTPGGLTNPQSLSVSKDGGFYLVIDDNDVKAYNYDGSSMIYNGALSLAGLNNLLAVALKPGSFDYAVLEENTGNPQVSYYAFNGTGMEEIPDLRITGLDGIGFANDQLLVGRAATAGYGVTGIKLLANVDTPPGTSVTWEVTVDGAVWKSIIPGGDAVKFSSAGTHPNYRARLHTDDIAVTPKVLDVQLIDSSLSVSGYTDKGEYKAGEAMIIYADTEGFADSVETIMWWTGGNGFTTDSTTDLVPELPVSNDLNTWYSRHDYPGDYDKVVIIPRDMADGEYLISIKAYRGSNEAEDTVTIQVVGSQFNKIRTEISDQEYMRYE